MYPLGSKRIAGMDITFPIPFRNNLWFRNVYGLRGTYRSRQASHNVPFVYTLRHIFILLCGRNLGFSIVCARVQNTQCGEISATLAETECSVSSVGVQSKGSFVVFLIIKV